MVDGPIRRHEHNGGVYVIRDVWGDDGRLIRCEYATVDGDGAVKWTPCREGVSFEEIAPLGHVTYIPVEKAD
jgi:hypothetical protein